MNRARRLSPASYNIHRCFGTDRKYLPERIAEVILALDADVVALQEVDMRLLVDGRPQLDYLSARLRKEAVAGANYPDHRGHFGNAVLSSLPVLAVRRIDLSVRRFEPRGALDLDLDMGGMTLRVIATHLGLDAAERRVQVRRLLHALDGHSPASPVLMLGDFNEWKPTGGALRAVNRRFGPSLVTLRTFPSRFPLLPLDRMWVWPPAEIHQVSAYASPLTRLASDHLPIRADITWAERHWNVLRPSTPAMARG